ncbi:hypothetical protein GCM10010401_07090 [Rarobacter faecitabidus]|uniref:Uncharacterized protein n=1 Tax=Rarobacter faecitabidus TaxID=13243 RepID=A0A542ZT57_RARFA|nr:hypothetical protein [Rarobacter faecitabidus]TQL63542.1 hypothetical protein FB461_0001 [Rarobacter faecitabidus]
MSTDITLPTERGTIQRASQATAVEQARAVAEVQAAVTVAQQIPRDIGRAEAEMRDSCGRLAVANKAFYSMPRAGGRVEGFTVHLMRELARIWGNVDYGVREMRRDDLDGYSEIQAFAWDQQTNVRSTRSFIVPHARMVKKERAALTDLGDIYLNNQNVGARAVRECIATILPTWFTETAQDVARHTLRDGEGVPLKDRIAKMVGAFAGLNVTQAMIEARLERKRSAWTAGDVADLTVVYGSIDRREITVEDAFPVTPITPGEIGGEG